MYGLAVGCFGIGVPHGDGRGFVEDVRLVPARYGNASHASGIVEVGDCANRNGNGRRASI